MQYQKTKILINYHIRSQASSDAYIKPPVMTEMAPNGLIKGKL
jgi:hypothetical protein